MVQGGTCDFRIYLLKSGSNTRGHGAIGAGSLPIVKLPEDPQPQLELDLPHLLQDFLHPHLDFEFPHLPHDRELENPSSSSEPPPTRTRSPSASSMNPLLYINPAKPRPPRVRVISPIINI